MSEKSTEGRRAVKGDNSREDKSCSVASSTNMKKDGRKELANTEEANGACHAVTLADKYGQCSTAVKTKESERVCCSTCKKPVFENSEALECNGCGFWHHADCEGVSGAVYKFLANNVLDTIHWYCTKCNMMFKKVFSTILQLEVSHRRLEEKVDSIVNRLDKDNTVKVAHVQETISSAVKEQLPEDKLEEEELERRKASVIIHGI